jgi:hypothetical protein
MTRLASQTGSEIGEIVLVAVLGMAAMFALGVCVILAPVWFALKPEPRKDRR